MKKGVNNLKTKAVHLHEISFTLNGKKVACKIKPTTVLLDLLRDAFELKGTKPGCLEGECGACSVLVNDSAINSCLYLAINVDGKEITTIEGFSSGEKLDEVQESMIHHGAVQCGFCTSGMSVSIRSMQKYYQKEKRIPTREEIKKGLEGNLCRCTGYVKIVDAAEKVLCK